MDHGSGKMLVLGICVHSMGSIRILHSLYSLCKAQAIDSLEAGDLWSGPIQCAPAVQRGKKTFVRLFLIPSNPPTICPRVFFGACDKNQEDQVRRGLVRQTPPPPPPQTGHLQHVQGQRCPCHILFCQTGVT